METTYTFKKQDTSKAKAGHPKATWSSQYTYAIISFFLNKQLKNKKLREFLIKVKNWKSVEGLSREKYGKKKNRRSGYHTLGKPSKPH